VRRGTRTPAPASSSATARRFRRCFGGRRFGGRWFFASGFFRGRRLPGRGFFHRCRFRGSRFPRRLLGGGFGGGVRPGLRFPGRRCRCRCGRFRWARGWGRRRRLIGRRHRGRAAQGGTAGSHVPGHRFPRGRRLQRHTAPGHAGRLPAAAPRLIRNALVIIVDSELEATGWTDLERPAAEFASGRFAQMRILTDRADVAGGHGVGSRGWRMEWIGSQRMIGGNPTCVIERRPGRCPLKKVGGRHEPPGARPSLSFKGARQSLRA